jgi:hypothetical protein
MKHYDFPPAAQLPEIKELPDPFAGPGGKRIASPGRWEAQREYLKAMVSHYMLGEYPQLSEPVRAEATGSKLGMDGLAVEETVRLFYVYGREFHFDVRILRPNREGQFPAIVYLALIEPEDEYEMVVRRGYTLVFFNCMQLTPDVSRELPPPGAVFPKLPCGMILAWGWGCRLVNDYLLTRPYVDPKALICTGASRGGKSALAAAIYDERIAICVAMISGCGGDGCLRFVGTKDRILQDPALCETVGRITSTFPDWFVPEFAAFGDTRPPHPISGREERLPFDAHTLRALIAPRAILSTGGMEDAWCNPYGTHIAWRAAQPVFDFLGVPRNNMIHVREGGHGENWHADWMALADFCDHHLFGKPLGPNINKPYFDMDAIPRHFDWEAPRSGK